MVCLKFLYVKLLIYVWNTFLSVISRTHGFFKRSYIGIAASQKYVLILYHIYIIYNGALTILRDFLIIWSKHWCFLLHLLLPPQRACWEFLNSFSHSQHGHPPHPSYFWEVYNVSTTPICWCSATSLLLSLPPFHVEISFSLNCSWEGRLLYPLMLKLLFIEGTTYN